MNDVLEHEGMHYEGNCIRPPSEGDSILLQVTLGCSHNKCTFCGAYKDKRFWVKDNEIILRDILFASKYMRGSNRVFLMDGDASNYLPIRVWLPEGKQQALDLIDAALREEVRLRPEWVRAF